MHSIAQEQMKVSWFFLLTKRTPSPALPHQRPILNPVRLRRIRAKSTSLILFIGLEVTLKPLHVAVALKRQNMRRHTIQKPPIMADHHRTTRSTIWMLYFFDL